MKIERSVDIQRPNETVFAFITDMSKAKLWLPVKEMRQLSDGPVGVGSTFTQTFEAMGQSIEATTQVTQYDPPHALTFKLVQGPVPLTTTMQLTPLDGDKATRLTFVGEVELSGKQKLMAPMINTMVKKQLDTQVAQLKQAVESEPV